MSYLDSRDLQKRIDELEETLKDMYEEFLEVSELTEDEVTFNQWYDKEESEDKTELEELIEFKQDAGSREWDYGLSFIPDSEFTEYAMEMLKDIGDLPRDIPWYIVIDEDATADNIKQDYSSVDFQGETYWYRD